MQDIKLSSRFKKSFKRVKSYPKFKKDKWEEVLTYIMQGIPLPAIYDDHKAAKTSPPEIKDKRILHLAPNICLIYSTTDEEVYLYDIGSHQDTGLTEDYNSI